MFQNRDTFRDGFINNFKVFLLTHFKWLWDFIQSNGFLRREINKFLINNVVYEVPTRPHPLSTMHQSHYTSWDSLTDRTFNGRHLPPTAINFQELKPVEEITRKLFSREKEAIPSQTSTLLFAYVAQWFTDGFLRSDRRNGQTNIIKNRSNHNVDLSPIYGWDTSMTKCLRSEVGGKLKSQYINGEEYPPYYFKQETSSLVPNPGFEALDMQELLNQELLNVPLEQQKKLFAMGSSRANVQIGPMMLNILLLREHNRICSLLVKEYKDWDDERLFQTARNILIVLTIKFVIEEYINHISPYYFNFSLDPFSFVHEKWYRQNWMTVEFNLLYRWHSLVPDKVYLGDHEYLITETQWNTDIVTSRGLGSLFEDASSQPAGELGLFNTPSFLLKAEENSIRQSREVRLASYNDYRAMCRFPRATDFNQITGNPKTQEILRDLYKKVANVEFYVGLFAEDRREGSPLPPLMGRLVAIDAFSQLLTNPLLAEHVFNEKTFSPLGFEIIQTTRSLSDILHRNISTNNKFFKVKLGLE